MTKHHSLGGPTGEVTSITLTGTPDSKTAQTIAAMRAIVHATDHTRRVHDLAVTLAAKCPQKAYLCQAQKVYGYIFNNVRFKKDTFGAEHLRHPDQLIDEMSQNRYTSQGIEIHCAADCDDVAMLGAGLLRAMGFRTAFITIGLSAAAPFSHVYFGAEIPGTGFVPMDPQERIPFGRESPMVRRRQVWWID